MQDNLEFARKVIETEIQGLHRVSQNLDQNFNLAVELVYSCKGKMIFTGMGKSGIIAKKCASTFSSTGTPSVFLHPADALHGDMGIISPEDVVLAISYGGESPELMSILKYCRRRDIPIISISGKMASSLATHSNVVLDASVESEACPLGLAPTTSSTATLAIGDALAMCVLKRRGFSDLDFAERHPSGSLGYRLLTKVGDVMHSGEALPFVRLDSSLEEVLGVMTSQDVRGVAGVLEDESLVGVITDGDIRRFIKEKPSSLENVTARELMSKAPQSIDEDVLAEEALLKMEQKRIQMLFVKSADPSFQKPIGIIALQDLLRLNLR